MLTSKGVLNRKFKFGIPMKGVDFWIYPVLIIYIILLGIIIERHEPWFDEAQAWLLARDSNVVDLLGKYLRFEGSPGLWHLLLMAPAKLKWPFRTINIIAGSFAVLNTYLILKYSPFPKYIKILLVFSFFLFYQYAVVARAYILIPILLFLIAIIYRDRHDKIYLFTLLLSLLALTSLHGAVFAISIISVHFFESIKQWQGFPKSISRKQLFSYGFFSLLIAIIVIELWPPNDLIIGGASAHEVFRFDLWRIIANVSLSLTEALFANRLSLTGLSFNGLDLCANILSGIILYVFCRWFYQRKVLAVFILGIIGLEILFSLSYASSWHYGIIFIYIVFVLWLSFKGYHQCPVLNDRFLAVSVILMMSLLLCVHLYWSFCSGNMEISQSYAGGRQVAQFLKENKLDKKIIYAKGFQSIGVLPYFDNNIFKNYNEGNKPAFWLWSKRSELKMDIPTVINNRPDVLIINFNQKQLLDDEICAIPNYQQLGMIRSRMIWKDRVVRLDDFLIFKIKDKISKIRINISQAATIVTMWNDDKNISWQNLGSLKP